MHLRDPSPQQREDGIAYIQENAVLYAQKTGKKVGVVHAFESLEDAIANSWLVIEAVPEKIQLKIDTFGELDTLAPADCILASNSSSYKSSEMLEKVSEAGKSRILNMHYYMPPQCMVVELMTNGHTEEGIFPFMIDRCKKGATLPYVARKQSTGFIFNRLWAAVKRETLTILAEGVSVPEEIDSLWTEMFVKGGATPCKTMDSEFYQLTDIYLRFVNTFPQMLVSILSPLLSRIMLRNAVFLLKIRLITFKHATSTMGGWAQKAPRGDYTHLKRLKISALPKTIDWLS